MRMRKCCRGNKSLLVLTTTTTTAIVFYFLIGQRGCSLTQSVSQLGSPFSQARWDQFRLKILLAEVIGVFNVFFAGSRCINKFTIVLELMWLTTFSITLELETQKERQKRAKLSSSSYSSSSSISFSFSFIVFHLLLLSSVIMPWGYKNSFSAVFPAEVHDQLCWSLKVLVARSRISLSPSGVPNRFLLLLAANWSCNWAASHRISHRASRIFVLIF